jgi:predicted negative regulator of RcsB-dependent stress response
MRALLLMCTLALLAMGPAAARRHDPEKLPLTHVRDLHYGDVLFYFYQEKDLESLTRLLAYEHWGRMPHHEDDTRLLEGGLYLELGMHNEAGRIFQSVLTNDVPTGVRNKAWFYLAQVWYARGYYDQADAALRKINGRMSADLEAQRELMFGNVLMHEGRFDEAISVLSTWRGAPLWSAYARFNLGVALVRNKRLSDADPFLSAVGTMLAPTPELAALRDRANLALGFAYLQAEQPARARPALARVRLNGPYSNKALLGIGWADAALGDYQGALTPWMELRNRNLLDAAVQESYLAVPYAFSKLNANAQSAEYYESAVNSFDAENVRLDGAIAAIKKGDMLEHVLAKERSQEARYGWAWQLKSLPEAPESRYLYMLLAGNDFQEGLKNYRGLTSMSETLERHADDMVAYQDMIDTREHAYAERLPRADALLASGAVDKLQQRDVALENELRSIEAQHDVAALGTGEEREQWARIQRVEATLNGAPDNAGNAELRARLALVRGVLFFRLNDAYGARLWQEHRELKDLSLALHETQSRWIRVERARKNVPANTGEFATRVAALMQRIDGLEVRLVAAEQQQRDYLARIAVRELEQQKDRLATYQIQARFALGSMYDRAASSEDARPSKVPVPVQKGVEQEAPPPEAPK